MKHMGFFPLAAASVPGFAQMSTDAEVLRKLFEEGTDSVSYTEQARAALPPAQLTAVLHNVETQLGEFRSVSGSSNPFTAVFDRGTATDALIDILGRQSVEELAPNSTPLLTTAEAFRLKNPENESLLREYRAGSESGKQGVLDLMTANSGLAHSDDWQRVAYKGGSEPGLINMTTYLESEGGSRYCVSVTNIREDSIVDEVAFTATYQGILFALR